MDDLISRSDAIGAVKEERFPIDSDYAEGFMAALDKVEWILKEWLPSAQPDSKELSFTHKALDTISRQAAIRWVKTECNPYGKPTLDFESGKKVIEHLKQMPSAQPETHDKRTETHSCDCISRQAAINALTSHIMPHNNEDGTVTIGVLSKSSIKNILNKLPSAQPEHTNSCYTNSWCIDCKEYDTENKCCPRYNRVIKQTLDDAYRHGETEAEARFHAQQMWIPCSERLPEEGQEILATTTDNAWGDVVIIRTYYKEMHKSVIAWMPLPEPYAERRTDD